MEKKKVRYAGCEDRWQRDKNFRQRMIEESGYTKADMTLFDQWAKEPKAEPKPMSKKERQEKIGNQKWRLTQTQPGGSDTIPTALYAKYQKENAIHAKARVTLTESTSWKESTKQEDSGWWQAPKEEKETPSSSSTHWNKSSWRPQDWQSHRRSQSKWTDAQWKQEEHQWKRRKW